MHYTRWWNNGSPDVIRRIHAHGQSKTRTYHIWMAMKKRCSNKKNDSYRYYGGRGIRVCAQWLQSYANFMADMGERPSPQHSLDRYPNRDGNYEPGNCRWATKTQQSRNTASNVLLTHNGVTHPLAEWAEISGIPYERLRCRVKRGTSPDKLFSATTLSNKENNY